MQKLLLVQPSLRMEPWRSFWECLWAASPCEALHHFESTIMVGKLCANLHTDQNHKPILHAKMSQSMIYDVYQVLTMGILVRIHTQRSRPSDPTCNLLIFRGPDGDIPCNSKGKSRQWSLATCHTTPKTDSIHLNYESPFATNVFLLGDTATGNRASNQRDFCSTSF